MALRADWPADLKNREPHWELDSQILAKYPQDTEAVVRRFLWQISVFCIIIVFGTLLSGLFILTK